MLTKVSIPNIYATNQIIKFSNSNNSNLKIDKIQDNLEGYLLIKYANGKTIMYNYYLNKFYSHNRIQIHFNSCIITKQIESFDQNNLKIASKIRSYVLKKINYLNKYEFNVKSILGIGGEYYLYWSFLNWVEKLTGISNHESIINDANTNIPWSINYLIDYNNQKSYPIILNSDIILINLSQININVITYIKKINYKKIIIISCSLSNSKLNLLIKNFIIKKIKYLTNYNGLIRIMELIS